jgi:hypothetical protein
LFLSPWRSWRLGARTGSGCGRRPRWVMGGFVVGATDRPSTGTCKAINAPAPAERRLDSRLRGNDRVAVPAWQISSASLCIRRGFPFREPPRESLCPRGFAAFAYSAPECCFFMKQTGVTKRLYMEAPPPAGEWHRQGAGCGPRLRVLRALVVSALWLRPKANCAKQDAHDKSPQVGLRPAFSGGHQRSIRLTPTFVVGVKQTQSRAAAGG